MQTSFAPTPKTNGSVQKNPEVVFQVYKTYNYDLFKIMEDNRDLNDLHVKRLVQSFQEQHLVCPIIVNEKLQVIDGQHRLQASKETGVPVYYMMIAGYGIKQVQILNTNQKDWNQMDFLHMWCAKGKPAYLEVQKFMNDFPDFGIQGTLSLIRLNNSGRKQGTLKGQKVHSVQDFEKGKLVIPNITKSYMYARKIMEFKPFYPGYHKGNFIRTIISLLGSPKYNHKEMIYKTEVCLQKGIRIVDSGKVSGYKMQLEDIYNWKRQKENKVSFRYE